MNPLIELFEGLNRDFGTVSLDDFPNAAAKHNLARFHFFSAVSGTSLGQVHHDCGDALATINNTALPQSLRTEALKKLQYTLRETVAGLRSGAFSIPRRRIRDEVVNRVTDSKVRQLCFEINSTRDQNVLTLAQLIGELLKWALWHKAKQNNTKLKESVGLSRLLDEVIKQKYYVSNATQRFLSDFQSNFMKTGYDMLRHSESYIPDVSTLNPQIDALEAILAESF